MPSLEEALRQEAASVLRPGAVVGTLADSDPQIYAAGFGDLEGSRPMATDAIFRISSLTKPLTALALLILLEEKGIGLDAPVNAWLPELAGRRVLPRLDAELEEAVPARRDILIQDVLASTLGIGIIPAPPGSTPIQQEVERLGLVGFGPPRPDSPLDADAWMRGLGALPLLAQPGDAWFYSVASNVQGVLVARLSGQPLSVVLADRIFEPLGMRDTGFHVPAGKLSRFNPAYRSDLSPSDGVSDSAWSRPPAFEAGEGGLVSTAADYMAFAGLLQGRGEARGKRLIKEDWLWRMCSDQLSDAQRAGASYFLDGRGWGFGVSTDPGMRQSSGLRGTIGWAGGLGSSWVTDFDHNRSCVVFCGRALDDPAVYAAHQRLADLALGDRA